MKWGKPNFSHDSGTDIPKIPLKEKYQFLFCFFTLARVKHFVATNAILIEFAEVRL
jgi:hypothetical protein